MYRTLLSEDKMKLAPIIKQNFKGYAAAPIKNIYLQNNTQESQKNIFNELKEVGKKEGFGVQIEQDGKLYQDINDAEPSERYMWAQDNKIIVDKDGKRQVLVSGVKPDFESELGKALDVETTDAQSVFEGGNVYIGKKPDGENYLIVGQDVVFEMAAAKFLDAKLTRASKMSDVKPFKMMFQMPGGYATMTEGGDKVSFEVDETEILEEQAKEQLSKDFNVKKENICIVPQLEFHIDMFLRPLDYPYILINDKNMADMVASEFGIKNQGEKDPLDMLDAMFLFAKEDKYATTIQKLKDCGFKPISVAGVFGDSGEVNYMNSFVNQAPDGSLSYIAMSSKDADKKFKELDSVFDNELKSKAPNIKNIHHISGGKSEENKDLNNIMANIYYRQGGLHCLGCEEPDFEKWG